MDGTQWKQVAKRAIVIERGGWVSLGKGLNLARGDGRRWDELRPIVITPGYLEHPEGSALIELGKTKVICAVSIEQRVPPFLRGADQGWITAEYGMLPRATGTRSPREAATGRVTGRTYEIQRLIGRSLRAVTELCKLGSRTFTVDCDVIQADGGTRTAAITGAYVALHQAMQMLVNRRELAEVPLRAAVAAISVGIVDGKCLLDLCYEEDSHAQVDFNVVMTDRGDFVEVQGTAEGRPFSRRAIDSLLDLGEKGVAQLCLAQRQAIERTAATT